MFTIALVGRPNVGKSTLFNRLVGRRVAIVHNEAGVTRDWKDAKTSWDDKSICVIDTPGLDISKNNPLWQDLKRLTLSGISRSDLAIFVADSTVGITWEDEEALKLLRKQGKPFLIAANKSDIQGINLEYINCGVENIAVSGKTGLGILDLKQEILKKYIKKTGENCGEIDKVKLAILGRPNAGKSTLMNTILGYERSLAGDEPGITRDTISADVDILGNTFCIYDTAGLRKKKAHRDAVEHKAALETKHALDFCHIAIVAVDAIRGIEKQELTIVSDCLTEGRPVILALNKWDAVDAEQKIKIKAYLKKHAHLLFNEIAELPIVYISAKHNNGIDEVFLKSKELYETWNKRVSTSQLNQWISYAITNHQPPIVKGRRLKLKYITQTSTRPPTFVIFSTRGDEVPADYLRYLQKNLATSFKMEAVPIRIILRTSENPFDPKK